MFVMPYERRNSNVKIESVRFFRCISMNQIKKQQQQMLLSICSYILSRCANFIGITTRCWNIPFQFSDNILFSHFILMLRQLNYHDFSDLRHARNYLIKLEEYPSDERNMHTHTLIAFSCKILLHIFCRLFGMESVTVSTNAFKRANPYIWRNRLACESLSPEWHRRAQATVVELS